MDSQAAIQVRSKQGANPPQVFVATLHAVFAGPQRDDGDESRLVVGDHHEASGESCDFSERAVNRGGQSGMDFVRFVWLGHELYAKRGNS